MRKPNFKNSLKLIALSAFFLSFCALIAVSCSNSASDIVTNPVATTVSATDGTQVDPNPITTTSTDISTTTSVDTTVTTARPPVATTTTEEEVITPPLPSLPGS